MLTKDPNKLYSMCKAGDRDACQEITWGKTGFMLQGNMMQRNEITGGKRIKEMAEGGFMLPEEMEEESVESWLPLIEIMGEESFAVIEELMEEYPEVVELAEMAMKTSDGYVEGMGGPKEDMVPARLSDGEFVFSAEAVAIIGLENLEMLHEQAKAQAGAMI